MRRAFLFGADPGTISVALAGFLLRGGIVLLTIPSVVLPSVIGLAGATGVSAFAIDGRPTPWLYEMSVIATLMVAVWLMLAFLLGSLIDVWLIEASVSNEPHASSRPRSVPELRTLIDMMGIRALFLVPLALSMIWASGQIYNAIYGELTIPSDLATPLPLRVIEKAIAAVVIVAIVWLVTEAAGAVSVRRLVLFNTGILRSLGDGLVQFAVRPVSSAATIGLTYGVSIVATGAALLATGAAFDWCRIAARNQAPMAVTIGFGSVSTTRDIRSLLFLLAAVALAITWIAALSISGLASAWRSAALTSEAADAGPGLSGSPEETSGD
ncbi:MAG TPA: hypothetical protein VF337_09870 [Candidatus Limnocylindrales bacterium]